MEAGSNEGATGGSECFVWSSHPRFRSHVQRWEEECQGVVSDSCLPQEMAVWDELVSNEPTLAVARCIMQFYGLLPSCDEHTDEHT